MYYLIKMTSEFGLYIIVRVERFYQIHTRLTQITFNNILVFDSSQPLTVPILLFLNLFFVVFQFIFIKAEKKILFYFFNNSTKVFLFN